MISLKMSGRARLLPDAVNTDYIISSRRKKEIPDLDRLAGYIFEDLPRPLDAPVMPGDILVAGCNFGCGSAMEVAVDVLRAAGVPCILARSVARTFYRNATNAGLPVILVSEGEVAEGDELDICYHQSPEVDNRTRGSSLVCRPIPRFTVRVVAGGGLIPYYRKHGMPGGLIG